MQKVRSYFFLIFTWAAYKTTISNLSFTVLYAVALNILYLALEEGSPLFSNRFVRSTYLFNILLNTGYSTFVHTNHRISFDFFSWSY